MTAFADHFSGHAARYAACRPTYPPEFIAHLAGFAPGHGLAWDCGCGNGQASVLLAAHFERVVATDASREQLANAAAHPHVEYRVAPERDSGLAAASVALVTAAQAYHWFDHAAFAAEVRRVLQPGGVVAVWCYQTPRIAPDVDAVLDRFYEQRIGAYWPPERRQVETGYRDLPFPFVEFDTGEWWIRAEHSREAFLNYVGTWSAVVKAQAAEGHDPVADLRAALQGIWDPGGAVRPVTWRLRVRAGRRLGAE